MDVAEIQHAIEILPPKQQIALLDWLADQREWEGQMERDFSPGGAGMSLLDRVKKQIRNGES